jgi:hypothetical protein
MNGFQPVFLISSGPRPTALVLVRESPQNFGSVLNLRCQVN